MDCLKSVFKDNPSLPYYAATGTALVVTSLLVYKGICKHRRRSREDLLKGPPDTVVLFQFPRGPYAPSLSPFPLKLETYMRMAKIPYESNVTGIMSSKGKIPWMVYNGEVVEDSQFCIEFLNEKRGVDVNKHLNKEQRAISKSLQIMCDEHLYWTGVYFRWIHDNELKAVRKVFNIPRIALWMLRRNLRLQLWGQGIGRHSPEQIQRIMRTDLTAFSDILGTKPFLMGDLPCEADCALFGMLCQMVYNQHDEIMGTMVQESFPNLLEYCYRMKKTFWPDWDEFIPKEKK